MPDIDRAPPPGATGYPRRKHDDSRAAFQIRLSNSERSAVLRGGARAVSP